MKYRDRGEYFEGEFKEARKNGFGILRAATWRHVGIWKDDKYHGLGLHVYENGDIYVGLWENGMVRLLSFIVVFEIQPNPKASICRERRLVG